MDPIVAASLAAAALGLLAVPVVAGELAVARERRAGAAELALERDRRALAEDRAAAAERKLAAVLAAQGSYLAALPDGPLADAAAGELLDATEHAAGAAGPPASGDPGGDRALGQPG